MDSTEWNKDLDLIVLILTLVVTVVGIAVFCMKAIM